MKGQGRGRRCGQELVLSLALFVEGKVRGWWASAFAELELRHSRSWTMVKMVIKVWNVVDQGKPKLMERTVVKITSVKLGEGCSTAEPTSEGNDMLMEHKDKDDWQCRF